MPTSTPPVRLSASRDSDRRHEAREIARRCCRIASHGRSRSAGIARCLTLGAIVGGAAFGQWAAAATDGEATGFDPFGFDATLLVACVETDVTVRYARRCDADDSSRTSGTPEAPEELAAEPALSSDADPGRDADAEAAASTERSIDANRVDSADWSFEPDRPLRRAIVEAYASRMDAVGNPDAARNAAILRKVDLIAVAGEALARFGLSGSNLADVMGVHASNLHDAATDRVIESTPETAAALSRQMAAVLVAADVARLDEPGERQRVADALIIDAVLLGARTEACASGKAEGFDCATFRARAAEIGQALYGVDLTTLALDAFGLRPD